eukprot:m.31559 g.31559  ORF g.31559 m.31559 type:complete len:424 (+) comp13988_c1_seq2:251-1522(+)
MAIQGILGKAMLGPILLVASMQYDGVMLLSFRCDVLRCALTCDAYISNRLLAAWERSKLLSFGYQKVTQMSKPSYKKIYTESCRNETKMKITKWIDQHPSASAEERAAFVREEVKAFAQKLAALQSKQAENKNTYPKGGSPGGGGGGGVSSRIGASKSAQSKGGSIAKPSFLEGLQRSVDAKSTASSSAPIDLTKWLQERMPTELKRTEVSGVSSASDGADVFSALSTPAYKTSKTMPTPSDPSAAHSDAPGTAVRPPTAVTEKGERVDSADPPRGNESGPDTSANVQHNTVLKPEDVGDVAGADRSDSDAYISVDGVDPANESGDHPEVTDVVSALPKPTQDSDTLLRADHVHMERRKPVSPVPTARGDNFLDSTTAPPPGSIKPKVRRTKSRGSGSRRLPTPPGKSFDGKADLVADTESFI